MKLTLGQAIEHAAKQNKEMDDAFGKVVTDLTVGVFADIIEPIANTMSDEKALAYFRMLARHISENADLREQS